MQVNPEFGSLHCHLLLARDLPGTCPACLLDRKFPENLFEQAKISMKNFPFWLQGSDNQIFS